MNLMSSLAVKFVTDHPKDAASRLSRMPPQESARFLDTLDPAAVAVVVEDLDPGALGGVISALRPETAGRLVEALAFHRAVGIIRQVDGPTRDRLLTAVSPTHATRLRWAASIAADTVATVADSTRNVFRTTSSVADALELGLDPRFSYLYVLDEGDRLVGVIHRATIEAAEMSVALESVMKSPVVSVPASARLATVREHPAWAKFDTLPITDAGGRYVGVLRHKTVHAVDTPRVGDSQSVVLSTVLEVGEVVWTGLYAAIENLAVTRETTTPGEPR